MKSIEQLRAMGLCPGCNHTPCVCDKEETPEEVMRREQMERFQEELETRPERIKGLDKLAADLFPNNPELHEQITQSYAVPQFDDYHREGMYMDTHLQLALDQIDLAFEEGLNPDLTGELREIVERTIGVGLDEEERLRRKEILQRFILTHDISKKDCLSLRHKSERSVIPERYYDGVDPNKIAAERPGLAAIKDSLKRSIKAVGDAVLVKPYVEYTWEEWNNMLPEDLKENPDPAKLYTFIKNHAYNTIGYIQQGLRRYHGAEGEKRLKELGVDDERLLLLVGRHEAGFTFDQVSARVFERNLSIIPESDLDWILTASYFDQMGSLQADGSSDYSKLQNILDSRHNYNLLAKLEEDFFARYQDKFESGAYKKATLTDLLNKYWSLPRRIDSATEIKSTIKKKFGIFEFDLEAAPAVIEGLMDIKGKPISEQEKKRLLELMEAGDYKTLAAEFGRVLGGNMRHVRALQKK
jgi:hypothetical protein